MKKIKIMALTKKAEEKIKWIHEHIRSIDRFFMKKMGTICELAKDNKSYTIILDQLSLKALTPLRSNPALAKKYEQDLVEKIKKDYKEQLLNEGLIDEKDYTMVIE